MKHGNRTKKMNICMLWLYYLGMYIQNSMFTDVNRGENLICGLSNEKRTHQHFKAYYYSLESRKNMLFECTNCNYVNSSLRL